MSFSVFLPHNLSLWSVPSLSLYIMWVAILFNAISVAGMFHRCHCLYSTKSLFCFTAVIGHCLLLSFLLFSSTLYQSLVLSITVIGNNVSGCLSSTPSQALVCSIAVTVNHVRTCLPSTPHISRWSVLSLSLESVSVAVFLSNNPSLVCSISVACLEIM